MIDKKDFVNVMIALAGNFGAELNHQTMKLWRDLFIREGIGIDQIQAAALEIIRTREIKTLPTYAEFIKHINGTTEDQAQVQADIVIEARRRHGAHERPKFNDPVTNFLMSHKWRWSDFVMEPLKNTPFWIKEFKDAYATYSRQARAGQLAIENNSQAIKKLTQNIG